MADKYDIQNLSGLPANLEQASTKELDAATHRLAQFWNEAMARKAELEAELERRGVDRTNG